MKTIFSFLLKCLLLIFAVSIILTAYIIIVNNVYFEMQISFVEQSDIQFSKVGKYYLYSNDNENSKGSEKRDNSSYELIEKENDVIVKVIKLKENGNESQIFSFNIDKKGIYVLKKNQIDTVKNTQDKVTIEYETETKRKLKMYGVLIITLVTFVLFCILSFHEFRKYIYKNNIH